MEPNADVSDPGSPDEPEQEVAGELAAELLVLTPVQLWNASIVLQKACGRATGGRRESRRKYFCLAAGYLNTAADLRGLPVPPPNAGYGSLKQDPDYKAL